MKKTILLFCLLTLLIACAKEKQVNSLSVVAPENLLNYIKSQVSDVPDAIISISANTLNNVLPTPQVRLTASLDSRLDNGAAIQEVSFANLKLPKVLDSLNNRFIFYTDAKDSNLFGQNAFVNFKTNFFDLKTDFNIPTLVKLQLSNEMLPKSKNYIIFWNKDDNNKLPIQINLQYDEIASTHLNPKSNFPKEDIQISKFVQDDGKCTLSTSELSKFPVGAVVRVSIMRGSYLSLKSNKKNVLIYSLSTDSFPILTVVE